MKTTTTLSIAQDFSPYPSGRRKRDGPFSGEAFRDDLLKPALRKFELVLIDLDGVAGLPSSFWEEVVGGAVRKKLIKISDINERLKFKASDDDLSVYIRLAYKYAQDAHEAMGAKS